MLRISFLTCATPIVQPNSREQSSILELQVLDTKNTHPTLKRDNNSSNYYRLLSTFFALCSIIQTLLFTTHHDHHQIMMWTFIHTLI